MKLLAGLTAVVITLAGLFVVGTMYVLMAVGLTLYLIDVVHRSW